MFCEKRRPWRFRGFHGEAPVLESVSNLVAGLITCGSPVWFVKFLRAPILKNICERLLLYCCSFVLLFFLLWYVPLIFNHFTFYLSISRDQLSSVFSWSLTHLARALVMFLFFSIFLASLRLHHTKLRLVYLLFTTCTSHGCISHLPKDSFTSLFCPCYNWRWPSDYTNTSRINSTMLQLLIGKFLLSVFHCSGVK